MPCSLETLKEGEISIGNDCGLSATAISSRDTITIGSNTLIGANTCIMDHDFHPLDPVQRKSSSASQHIKTEPVSIGTDVFIGTGVTILKGTKIGDRSIVAAGAVVAGLDVPCDSLVTGNPAKARPLNATSTGPGNTEDPST